MGNAGKAAETLKGLLDRIPSLRTKTVEDGDFVRWRKDATLAVKEHFPGDDWRLFNDIPYYSYVKTAGFFSKKYDRPSYIKGLAKAKLFLEKKAAELEQARAGR